MRLIPFAALALGLSQLLSCSVLNTMGMSADCRNQYNLCLDGCPQPPPNLDSNPQGQVDTVTPSCVEDCNRTAGTCK